MQRSRETGSTVMTHRSCSIALMCGLALTAAARDAAAAFIPVTTLVQKISSTGGCSLQEAIYSANLHSNIAIDLAINVQIAFGLHAPAPSGASSIAFANPGRSNELMNRRVTLRLCR